ncbi:hypothetical protein N657DRAFT_646693 [Parathielavia appendiculata]|uniref:Uncharacterized protein n=1 Tax=Parathielavia appendiculata TaxID=2587402 RepID=A0AAN6Z2I2_9PEZI|nr:hypothetical protein N657DRAFT_646693 [Parathielavia appendiculata]
MHRGGSRSASPGLRERPSPLESGRRNSPPKHVSSVEQKHAAPKLLTSSRQQF